MPHGRRDVGGPKAAQFHGGLGQQGDSTGHLLLNSAEMLNGANLRGVGEQVQAVGDGFYIPQGLAKIVHQLHEDGFRRGSFG